MKRTYNIEVTHVFADGSVMTDKEFFRKPFEVVAENNYELLVKCNRVLDPNYERKEHLRRRFQRAEERRAELYLEQQRIAEELGRLRNEEI